MRLSFSQPLDETLKSAHSLDRQNGPIKMGISRISVMPHVRDVSQLS
jgi:hypothetical protein